MEGKSAGEVNVNRKTKEHIKRDSTIRIESKHAESWEREDQWNLKVETRRDRDMEEAGRLVLEYDS